MPLLQKVVHALTSRVLEYNYIVRILVEYLSVLVVFVHAWQCWDCPFSRQHKLIQAKKFSQVEKAVAKYKHVLLMSKTQGWSLYCKYFGQLDIVWCWRVKVNIHHWNIPNREASHHCISNWDSIGWHLIEFDLQHGINRQAWQLPIFWPSLSRVLQGKKKYPKVVQSTQ